jgi:hypothetical protein
VFADERLRGPHRLAKGRDERPSRTIRILRVLQSGGQPSDFGSAHRASRADQPVRRAPTLAGVGAGDPRQITLRLGEEKAEHFALQGSVTARLASQVSELKGRRVQRPRRISHALYPRQSPVRLAMANRDSDI